jgi:hypothetical protein
MYFYPGKTRKERIMNRARALLLFLPPLLLLVAAAALSMGEGRRAPLARATPEPSTPEASTAVNHAGGTTTTVYTVYPSY